MQSSRLEDSSVVRAHKFLSSTNFYDACDLVIRHIRHGGSQCLFAPVVRKTRWQMHVKQVIDARTSTLYFGDLVLDGLSNLVAWHGIRKIVNPKKPKSMVLKNRLKTRCVQCRHNYLRAMHIFGLKTQILTPNYIFRREKMNSALKLTHRNL